MITFNIKAVDERLGHLVRNLIGNMPRLKFAVAGGAVRDLLMGRPVKDIDILVEQCHPLTAAQLADLQDFFGTTFKEYDSESTENYDDEDRIHFPVAIYTGKGVDIIVVPDIFAYVDDFPDDISKVAYDRLGLSIREGFIESHDKQVITYRNSAGGGRLQRLLDKYPYRVVHTGTSNA